MQEWLRWDPDRSDRNEYFLLVSLNIASHKSQFVNHHSVVCPRTEKPSLARIKVTVYKASLRVGGSYFFPRVHRQCPSMKKKSSKIRNIVILMIKRSRQQHQNKLVLSQTDGDEFPKSLVLSFYYLKVLQFCILL